MSKYPPSPEALGLATCSMRQSTEKEGRFCTGSTGIEGAAEMLSDLMAVP